jgi:hypothetical protein
MGRHRWVWSSVWSWARASYVWPPVPDAYLEGSLAAAVDRAEEHERLSHSESAMLLILA